MSVAQEPLPVGNEIQEGFNDLRIDDTRLGPGGEPAPRTDEEYAQSQMTLRAIVSSKEAGVIIGKGGKNVAELRDETGVKAGVSKVVPGIHDRVLTVTGGCEAISRAYAIVAKCLVEGAPMVTMGMINRDGEREAPTTHSEYSSGSHCIKRLVVVVVLVD